MDLDYLDPQLRQIILFGPDEILWGFLTWLTHTLIETFFFQCSEVHVDEGFIVFCYVLFRTLLYENLLLFMNFIIDLQCSQTWVSPKVYGCWCDGCYVFCIFI